MNAEGGRYRLGTVEASEAVISDLYLSLRDALFKWSRVTMQTPQPRMGYVGQHLTSVVTGFPGGRSGARGKDLVLPGGRHAEVKTCYRVDQLGSCRACGAVVAAVEVECPACRSNDIVRRDDSKWLLAPRNERELGAFFEPEAYYFVLFDFQDLSDPTVINARIWEVDPKSHGFACCIIDYYFNIRAKSVSAAPFNLWPFSLKFQLMEPTLIYHSQIDSENRITTRTFPGRLGAPEVVRLDSLPTFGSSRGLSVDVAWRTAGILGVEYEAGSSKAPVLESLERARQRRSWDEKRLVLAIVEAMYRVRIEGREAWLPGGAPWG